MDKFLYTETNKLKEYYLKVDSIHSLYISHYGNSKKPIVFFLHGGPGASSENIFSRFFSPKHFHIILFDQRGCGKSKPLGELRNNETKYLINDIELIRKYINAKKKIILFGGSWGATLSILYAITYPKNILYYIVRGISLCDNIQGDVFTKSLSLMYPELWYNYTSLVKTKDPLLRCKKYYEKIKFKNKKFIDTWFDLEFKTLTPDPKNNNIKMSENEKYIVCLLKSHYYSNKFFMKDNFIINNCNLIDKIPGIFIHGRLDVICNVNDSYRLSKKLPNSELFIIENAGHSYYDPLITKAMICATKKLIVELYKIHNI